MAEFNFLKYCKLRLTAAGYPASVQVEILELGFKRNWMCALHTGISNWLPVETVQQEVLRNVVKGYIEVRRADTTAGAGTTDESNVALLHMALLIENAVGKVTGASEAAREQQAAPVALENGPVPVLGTPSVLGSGKPEKATEGQVDQAATSPHTESLPIRRSDTSSSRIETVGPQTEEVEKVQQVPGTAENFASPAQQDLAIDHGLGGQDHGKKAGDLENISNCISGPPIGTSDPDDDTAHGSRTSSGLGNSSPAPTAKIAAQGNDSEDYGQEGSGSEETMAGTTGSDDLQEQLDAACEEVKATLSDIIDQVVRNEGDVTDLDAPAAGNALALLTYDYRKCLVDKREALMNPGILQGTLQEQLAAARAHFHSSTVAKDPHISRIIQSLSAHIWDPSSDQHQPFPHVKDLAAPCTKKMYAEWNLAVNGVLKRFSNEAFMTWKHSKTQEFFQWEELKGLVDQLILEQIQMGITTGDLEKKVRNKRQGGSNMGPAKKRARKDVVEDEGHEEETGSSGSGSTKKERVDRMRQRYGNLKKFADSSE
ncbi:hypothetical protein CAEBREN_06577 [Caenorhabditis brenneri]|uniref:Uncharacterized protein n=1 Tax=Caenorhabditis brenneri TaxID=135651 RepID=G0MMS3_CAEBE|nr:hypothetical protein CAEBREN_06577 [Caenorhabditis brenneri]